MSNTTIYLWYPSKIIGGAELLLLKIGEFLSKQEANVTIIDYVEGFLYKEADKYNLKKLAIEENTPSLGSGVLITPASEIYSIHKLKFLGDNIRLLFWQIHPYNLYPSYPIIGRLLKNKPTLRSAIYSFLLPNQIKRIKLTYSVCEKTNSLAFMDNACYEYNSRYVYAKTPFFLPIPISISANNCSVESNHSHQSNIFNTDNSQNPSDIFEKEKIKLGWLGRVDSQMKLPVLKILVSDLNEYLNRNNKIANFHVIGSGDGLDHLKEFSKKLKNINFHFHGSIPNELLGNALINNIDLLFAMGTSALEGGIRAIPTVLLDVCTTHKLKNYKYRWLYQTKNYSLGYIVSCARDIPKEAKMTIDDIMLNYNIAQSKIGNQCKLYSITHHSIDSVGIKLISRIKDSTLTIGELKQESLFGEKQFC